MWQIGFLPFILLLSLIVASPVSLQRKGMALLLGSIVFHLALLGVLRLKVSFMLYEAEIQTGLSEAGWQYSLLEGIHQGFINNPSFYTFVPLLLWVVVTFRVAEIRQFRQSLILKNTNSEG